MLIIGTFTELTKAHGASCRTSIGVSAERSS